jgi:hypothetical protein
VLNFAERGLNFFAENFCQVDEINYEGKKLKCRLCNSLSPLWSCSEELKRRWDDVAHCDFAKTHDAVRFHANAQRIAFSRKRTTHCDFMQMQDALRFHANARRIAISCKRTTHCDFAKTQDALRFRENERHIAILTVLYA